VSKALHASALVAWLCLAQSVVHAFDVPQRTGWVNDHANMLPVSVARQLDARLEAFEKLRGHRFALLTIPSLNGVPIEEYAIKVGDAWQVANRKRDDGLLMVIARDDHKLRIEVGYGLEGVIPDAVAARVTREILTPALQRGDAASGIMSAFDALIAAAGGDNGAQPVQHTQPRQQGGRGIPVGLLIGLAIFLIFNSFTGGFSRRRRGGFYGPIGFGGGGFGGGGGSWGGGGGGGGGGWGGGGGDGGGSGFGGGGASGSW
jgi:uncharacterized protein